MSDRTKLISTENFLWSVRPRKYNVEIFMTLATGPHSFKRRVSLNSAKDVQNWNFQLMSKDSHQHELKEKPQFFYLWVSLSERTFGRKKEKNNKTHEGEGGINCIRRLSKISLRTKAGNILRTDAKGSHSHQVAISWWSARLFWSIDKILGLIQNGLAFYPGPVLPPRTDGSSLQTWILYAKCPKYRSE